MCGLVRRWEAGCSEQHCPRRIPELPKWVTPMDLESGISAPACALCSNPFPTCQHPFARTPWHRTRRCTDASPALLECVDSHHPGDATSSCGVSHLVVLARLLVDVGLPPLLLLLQIGKEGGGSSGALHSRQSQARRVTARRTPNADSVPLDCARPKLFTRLALLLLFLVLDSRLDRLFEGTQSQHGGTHGGDSAATQPDGDAHVSSATG